MLSSENFCCTFADYDARCLRIAGRYARKDRTVGDPKSFYTIDFEIAVDHRHGVSAHLGGAGLMPIGRRGITDEPLQLGALQVARHYFAPGERPKCGRVADLPTQFHAGDCRLEVIRMGQRCALILTGSCQLGPVSTISPGSLAVGDLRTGSTPPRVA